MRTPNRRLPRRSVHRQVCCAFLLMPAVLMLLSACSTDPRGGVRAQRRVAMAGSVGNLVSALSPQGVEIAGSRLDLCQMQQYNWKVKTDFKRICTVTHARIVAVDDVEAGLAHLQQAMAATGCGRQGKPVFSLNDALRDIGGVMVEYQQHLLAVTRSPSDATHPLNGRQEVRPFLDRDESVFLSCPPDREVQIVLFKPDAPVTIHPLGFEAEGDRLLEHAPWPADIDALISTRHEPLLIQVKVSGVYAEQPWSLWDRMTPL